jgi:hypothetical protein
MLGLLAAIWAFFSKQDLFQRPGVRITIFGLIIGIVIFLFGMNLGAKKFDRYLIPIYAPMNIIAGLGWTAVAFCVKEKMPSLYSRFVATALLIAVIGIQIWSSFEIFPYTLSYYNPLLGGGRKALQVMQIGWGEGLDQAAFYLNRKENPQEIQALTWYRNGPFSYYFDGELRKIKGNEFMEDNWRNLEESDYLVIYVHQWQRNLPAELLEYIEDWDPEHSIWINSIEYARIYKVPK